MTCAEPREPIIMKIRTISLRIAIVLGVASFSGCMDPYYGETRVTTYRHYKPGYYVNTLPSGYRTHIVGGVRYYRYNDVYYRPRGRGYVVVESPRYGRNWDRDRGRRDWDRDRGRRDGYRDRDRDYYYSSRSSDRRRYY
jgi:hypothetical protein